MDTPGKLDQSEIEAIVEQHLPWSDAIARHIHHRLPGGFELDDLTQAGRIGLWKAARAYELDRGTPFLAWAYAWVQGECWMVVRRREYAETAHAPLCECISTTEEFPDRDMDRERASRRLWDRLDMLNRRERSLIRRHYRDGWPMRRLARYFGVSLTGVYVIRQRALAKMQVPEVEGLRSQV